MYNCINIILLIVLLFLFTRKKENYSINIKPTYTLKKNGNNYIKNENCSDFSDTLKNPDDYNNMLIKLINDLSTNDKININDLKKENYLGDCEYITNFLNKKINNLVYSKDYLQKNNNWKYEQFHVTEPNIEYYIGKEYNIYKITFILANTIRSTYTLFSSIIKEENNNLHLIDVKLANSINHKEESSKILDTLPLDIQHKKYNNIELNIEPDIPSEFK